MSPTRVTTDFAGAWRRAGAALAWVGGVALQLQQPALWDAAAWPLLAAAALATWLVARAAWRRGGPRLACVLSGLALAIAGFGYAGWRAELRLADALAPAWEGCDIELVGTVDDMPQLAPDGEHFAFVVESARPLSMTPRELKRVRSLAAAAGQPLPAAVAAAETTGAQAPWPGDADGDDDEAIPPAPPPGAGTPVLPSRVWLMWGRNQRDDRSVAEAPPPLHAGQRWRLPVRLRRPHGAMNPDGFDAELWLFDQGLRATGTVRGNGQLLSTSWAPIGNARQWVRDRLLLANTGRGAGDAAAHGALAALAVGDQAAIDGAGWEVFRNTGVSHLMSISGLHITMLGWLGGAAVGALWRRSERAALRVPAPAAARWGGLAVAWLYALLAGWGVPAQRTVVMLAATAALRGAGLDWPAALVALAAMLPVTLLDPWALLQPGFWLSFAAVGLLMVSTPARPASRGATAGAPAGAGPRLAGGEHGLPEGPRLVAPVGGWPPGRAVAGAPAHDVRRVGEREGARATWEASAGHEAGRGLASPDRASLAGQGHEADGPAPAAHGWRAARAALARLTVIVRAGGALAGRVGTELRGGVRAQLVATIGLAPLTLVAFQQVSPAGLLANLVAEPWVTLVVTPLTLLGILLPPLWTLAALALKPLLWWLAWLARWPLASVHVATAPAWSLAAGLAGGAILMLPLPWRVRGLGLAMLPPLLWPFVARPPEGRFELVAADVGQGTAVLVRTRGHLLLFDTGPRLGDDNDAGRRLLLPLLQARGEPRLDTLLLSHADADHVGGAQSLIDRMPVLALRSSLPAGNPLRANPIPHTACLAGQAWRWDGVRFTILHPFPGDYRPGAKTNALSCVLRVDAADGSSALLTGDVEAAGEARLVARARAAPGDPAVRLRSDVLVVPHHGSRTSSTDAFLDAVRPGVAVIQVGYRSRYGHPAPDVVARYRAHGIPVVRSDHCGAWSWSDGRARCTRDARRRYWHWQGADPPLTPPWIGRPPPPGEP
ncbi:MAG: DNA internalization-related competence protein ComEC/Rec2 [Burkholderiales bacterium]|nr:DNA internalization-related competence protein ComEC/Rec2 [Burkholderiales bacterium]